MTHKNDKIKLNKEKMLKTQFTTFNNIVSRQIFKNKRIKINPHNHTFVKNVLLNNEIKTFTKQRRSK